MNRLGHGVVEGFYGRPWSLEARLRMVRVALITSVAAAVVFVVVAWAMNKYLVPYVPVGPGAG